MTMNPKPLKLVIRDCHISKKDRDDIAEYIFDRISFMTKDEAEEELVLGSLLESVPLSYDYKFEYEDIRVGIGGTFLTLKATKKDDGDHRKKPFGLAPTIVPLGCFWYYVTTAYGDMQVSAIDNLEDFKYGSNYTYFCMFNEKLEVVDFNIYFSWYDDSNQEIIEEAKKHILHTYGRYIKKTGTDTHITRR